MTFTDAELLRLRADDGVSEADPKWSLRVIPPPRSFEQHVENLVCDLACLAPATYVPRIAYALAMAERTGIRSVWIHGLWRLTPSGWETA